MALEKWIFKRARCFFRRVIWKRLAVTCSELTIRINLCAVWCSSLIYNRECLVVLSFPHFEPYFPVFSHVVSHSTAYFPFHLKAYSLPSTQRAFTIFPAAKSFRSNSTVASHSRKLKVYCLSELGLYAAYKISITTVEFGVLKWTIRPLFYSALILLVADVECDLLYSKIRWLKAYFGKYFLSVYKSGNLRFIFFPF